ncbi:MAG TPA: GDSL-type esterase/lipase family protein [Gemmata sp.]|nr:GDSL-type esterase/lipase family protein [Gemmata sp.]
MLPAVLLLVTAQAPEIGPMPRVFDPFAKWEKDIAAIEKKLSANPPPAGGVLFVGSSSIVRWDLAKTFPGEDFCNVGFGGSTIPDCTHFASRIVAPYHPATIVFYAGDNDIAQGHKPMQVASDFHDFVAAVRRNNPTCRILFIPVKPSIARWKLFGVQKEANALVRAYCEKEMGLAYVDIVSAMLRADGTPDPELFVKDGLHMSPKGYEIWTAAVRKTLAK